MQWLYGKRIEEIIVLILVVSLFALLGFLGWICWYAVSVYPLEVDCNKWGKVNGTEYANYDHRSGLCVMVFKDGTREIINVEDELN